MASVFADSFAVLLSSAGLDEFVATGLAAVAFAEVFLDAFLLRPALEAAANVDGELEVFCALY